MINVNKKNSNLNWVFRSWRWLLINSFSVTAASIHQHLFEFTQNHSGVKYLNNLKCIRLDSIGTEISRR